MVERQQPRHRFFVAPGTEEWDHARWDTDTVQLERRLAHQLARVLRLREGEHIVVLDGSGEEREIELVAVNPSRVVGLVRETRRGLSEPKLAVTLYQALVPRDKLEQVLQKGTEVGVSAFVPISCERSLVRDRDMADERRLTRWRRIVQEAAEQSRRARMPEVKPPLTLAKALTEATAAGPALIAWEGERRRSIRDALRAALVGADTSLSLFVGPEGGFTEAEVTAAREAGALSISLGPRILRTETAGPVVAALALYEAGDMAPAM